jgi:integrase
MTRRGQGEGSIFQRKDGRWQATLDLGWRGGKRIRRSYYRKTRKAAHDALRQALRELEAGVAPGRRSDTVGAYLLGWLDSTTVRPTTRRRYEQIVANQLIPHLGRIPLAKLTPTDVEAMLHELAADLAPRSVHHVRAVLRTALTRAVRHGLLARNVSALSAAPAMPRREAQSLSTDQVRLLLEAIEGHPMRALIVLALATGLRSGELRGLQWSDIDWTTGTVTVRRSLQRVDGAFIALEPKTAASRRTLPLPTVALEALREHRRWQTEAPIGSAYVFTQPNGQPLHPTTAWRALQLVLGIAALPAMPFHALRHTAASLLLAEGVHPRVVMELLGHSTIRLTMDTYSHVIPALERDAADRLNRLLGGAD